MRHLSYAASVLCVLLCLSAARADEATEARAVLDRAVKAVGGEEPLTRLAGASVHTQGTFQVGEVRIDLTGDFTAQAEERSRYRVEISVMGRTQSGTVVFGETKSWARADSATKTEEIPEDAAAFVRSDFRALRLAQRLVPLRAKEYRLSHLGELKINDRLAVGIKAVREGQPDLDLFFDKETGLPLQARLRVKEGNQGMELEHVFTFADYKEFNGVKQFTKVTMHRDDKLFMEMELSGYQLQEKIDDSTFAKP